MYRLTRSIFLIIPLMLFGMIKLNAVEVLTWEDCVKEARRNHPDLVSASEKARQAGLNTKITKSGLLPQISGDASARKSGVEGQDSTNSYSYGFSIRQLIYDGFKTSSDVSAASESAKAVQYNYLVVSSNVRQSLSAAFAELLRAQELVPITETIAARRKQNLELVQLRYKAGREHKGSLLTAEADFAQAQYEVQQAKRNVSLAQRRLIKELGRGKFSPIEVKGDFEYAPKEEQKPDLESLADSTPLLKQIIANKEAVRYGLRSAKASLYPQIYTSVSAGASAQDFPPDQNDWSVGISLSVPLFEGGANKARISKAESSLNQAAADERSDRDNLILTLERTWKSLQDAIDTVSVQKKYFEAAEERAKIANVQYSTGLISFDNWVIIEDNLVNARKSYLNARANVLLTEADWIQAKGETLDDEK
jgi:outer membrane protein TolC